MSKQKKIIVKIIIKIKTIKIKIIMIIIKKIY